MDGDTRDTETLLAAVSEGERAAFDELYRRLYGELRRQARWQRFRWRGDHTLNTTALVHETYLKMARAEEQTFREREHLLAVAASAMRQLLIDYARAKNTRKRGGDRDRVDLEEDRPGPLEEPLVREEHLDEVLALDQALEELAKISEREARIVECRFFGGMTVAETAGALDISPATVKRGWVTARAWLERALGG